MSRVLVWDGCVNVRDLGGLPTAGGGTTRFGSVVRSDNARRLSDAGWEALVAHGVRRVVDLRTAGELDEDPPRELPIEAVHVSLLGAFDDAAAKDLDARVAHIADSAEQTRAVYVEFLERFPANFASAVAAVAGASEGGVLVHCAAGKDRTGLVVALLLSLAGVPEDAIAEDYAESEANLAELTGLWVAEASDEAERRRRIQMSRTPREAMLGVLEHLRAAHGGAEAYLRAAGLDEPALVRVRARLRGSG